MISIYRLQITPNSSYSQSKNKCSHKTSCLVNCHPRSLLQRNSRAPQELAEHFRGGGGIGTDWNWSGAKWRSETVPPRLCVQSIFLPPKVFKAFRNNPMCYRYHIPLCCASPDILSISLLQCASFQGLCPQESLLLCTCVFPQGELGLRGNPPKYCRYTEWDPLLRQWDTTMPQVCHWKETQVGAGRPTSWRVKPHIIPSWAVQAMA